MLVDLPLNTLNDSHGELINGEEPEHLPSASPHWRH